MKLVWTTMIRICTYLFSPTNQKYGFTNIGLTAQHGWRKIVPGFYYTNIYELNMNLHDMLPKLSRYFFPAKINFLRFIRHAGPSPNGYLLRFSTFFFCAYISSRLTWISSTTTAETRTTFFSKQLFTLYPLCWPNPKWFQCE